MVATYISLRLKQFARFYSFNGMHPLLGIPLTGVLFTLLSILLYNRIPGTNAAWVYCGLTIAAITELQNTKSNDLLKRMMTPKGFYSIKLAENLLLLLPFASIMAYQQSWLQLAAVLTFTIPYSYYSTKLPRPQIKALPSPYKGFAYEANYGFRAMFVAYLLYIALLIAGCVTGNVYILLPPFFILLFCMVASYSEMEAPIYIWMYRITATGYLARKWYTLAVNYCITFLPFLLAGLVFYIAEWQLIVLCFTAGLVALTGVMFIKYQFYGGGVITQIMQFLFCGCIMAGIAMPVIAATAILYLPFAGWRAHRNIKNILQC